MAETDEWLEDDYDYEDAPDGDDCLCEQAELDVIEGRGWCPFCGRAWWLSSDEIKAELRFMAEYAESVADEMASPPPVARSDETQER